MQRKGEATQAKAPSFGIGKNTNTEQYKKVVHNNLHAFVWKSDDTKFEKP